MDNLLKIGISKETINEIEKNNSLGIVEDLDFKYKKVKEIIDIFKMAGINNIEDFLIYKPQIFYKKPEYIYEKMKTYNILELRELLSEDINNIDKILN